MKMILTILGTWLRYSCSNEAVSGKSKGGVS